MTRSPLRSVGVTLLAATVVAGVLTGCVPTAHLEQLDCEVGGFPCSWAEASADSQRASLEVLDRASNKLDAGAEPGEVAAELRDSPGVATAFADETGVQLRVEGGPVVVAFAPQTHPVASAIVSAAEDPGSAHETVSAPATANALSVRTASVRTASDLPPSGYAPTREPDIRPRSALVLRPFEQVDLESVFSKLVELGLVEPDADVSALSLDDYGLGAAVAVLESSPHLSDPVRAVDDEAFGAFGEYDIVYVQTHSSTFDPSDGCDSQAGHVCGQVLGGFPLGQLGADTMEVLEELEFGSADRLPPGATIGKVVGVWTIAYTPDFFRQNYGGSTTIDTIVFLNACSSAATIDEGFGGSVMSGLASLVTDGRGPAVFGWTRLSDALPMDRASATVLESMLRDGASAAQAYAHAAADTDLVRHEVAGRTTEMRFAGRDIRARDVVVAERGRSELMPAAILEVEGEPEDGRKDSLVRLDIRVDGVVRGEEDDAVVTWQLIGRHDEPVEIENPFVSGPGRVVVEETPADVGPGLASPWTSYRITMSDVDLGFDLREEELVRETALGYPLRVEIARAGGDPSRHTVDPVYLRQATLDVLDPNLGQELESGDLVEIDGAPNDGVPEQYEIRVRIESLDEEQAAGATLRVRFGERDFSFPGAAWQREADSYLVSDTITLGDFQTFEQAYAVEAWVESEEGFGIAQHLVDPLELILVSDPCELVSARQVSEVMGRPFALGYLGGENDFLGAIVGDVCRWDGADSSVLLSSTTGTRGVRESVDSGDPRAIPGLGDAAIYDLDAGNAENPSGRRDPITGEMRWNNFVVLEVAVENRLYIINVQGNIVVDDGPAGVLERLRSLMALVDPQIERPVDTPNS